MLPRAHRLSSGREIARTYRKGRTTRSDLFRLSWMMSRGLARVAVVTSRKLSTKAAQRNLLKRQVRGIVRELLSRLVSTDLVVELLPSIIQQARAKHREAARQQVAGTLGYDVLKHDLTALLERNRLLQVDARPPAGEAGITTHESRSA